MKHFKQIKLGMLCLAIVAALMPSPAILASEQTPFDLDDAAATESVASSSVAMNSSRLDSIEARLTILESTAINAVQARKIAEEVVEEKLNELRLAIQMPNGSQRVESVTFAEPQVCQDGTCQLPIASVTLQPGEQIKGYTVPSGNFYAMPTSPSRVMACANCPNSSLSGQSIEVWNDGGPVEMRSVAQTTNGRRTMFFRPFQRLRERFQARWR